MGKKIKSILCTLILLVYAVAPLFGKCDPDEDRDCRILEPLIFTKNDRKNFKIPKNINPNNYQFVELDYDSYGCALNFIGENFQTLCYFSCRDTDESTYQACKKNDQELKYTYKINFLNNKIELDLLHTEKKLSKKDEELWRKNVHEEYKFNGYTEHPWHEVSIQMEPQIVKLFPAKTRFVDYIRLNTKSKQYYFILAEMPFCLYNSYDDTVIVALVQKEKKSSKIIFLNKDVSHQLIYTSKLYEKIIKGQNIVYLNYQPGPRSDNGTTFKLIWFKDLK